MTPPQKTAVTKEDLEKRIAAGLIELEKVREGLNLDDRDLTLGQKVTVTAMQRNLAEKLEAEIKRDQTELARLLATQDEANAAAKKKSSVAKVDADNEHYKTTRMLCPVGHVMQFTAIKDHRGLTPVGNAWKETPDYPYRLQFVCKECGTAYQRTVAELRELEANQKGQPESKKRIAKQETWSSRSVPLT